MQEYFYEDYSKIQLVLGDNEKPDELYKFVVKNSESKKDIFKGNPDIDMDEDNRLDDNYGIEDLTAAGKNHFHYVVIDLCEEELFPGTDKKYQTVVYDVESGNFWLGKDCDHLYSYGKCAIENYRADTDLLAYVEGKWEVPEYQTFYDYLCSMDWLKTC